MFAKIKALFEKKDAPTSTSPFSQSTPQSVVLVINLQDPVSMGLAALVLEHSKFTWDEVRIVDIRDPFPSKAGDKYVWLNLGEESSVSEYFSKAIDRTRWKPISEKSVWVLGKDTDILVSNGLIDPDQSLRLINLDGRSAVEFSEAFCGYYHGRTEEALQELLCFNPEKAESLDMSDFKAFKKKAVNFMVENTITGVRETVVTGKAWFKLTLLSGLSGINVLQKSSGIYGGVSTYFDGHQFTTHFSG